MKKSQNSSFALIALSVVLVSGMLTLLAVAPIQKSNTDPDELLIENPAVWVGQNSPSFPQVVLFRHSFRLVDPAPLAELEIFADTRYEVWIDGDWIGRGPARFSRTLQEFDVYKLDPFHTGTHTIAVLVQWAPNIRRSESTVPQLTARILSQSGFRKQILTKTGSDWKARLSDAWQHDSAPVHDWGLIGPTELLDLRRLPMDWHQPGFPDQDWPDAVLLSRPENALLEPVVQPRSIEHLAEYRMPLTLLDAGLLSPHCSIVEISPPVPNPYELKLQVSSQAELVIETVSISYPFTMTAGVDGNLLHWAPSPEDRLDVFKASAPVEAGPHQLVLTNIPDQGATFCISRDGGTIPLLALEQGVHAGRRTLLAELASDLTQVHAAETAAGLDLEFRKLPAYVVLDAGRTIHGRIYLEVEGPAGSILDIGWDERLHTGSRRPYPYPGSLYPQWNQVDSWVLDGRMRSIYTIDARAGRYILIAVWGEGPVRLSQIQALEERYPIEQVGEFHSSNPLLDRIWQVGVDTLRPNMTDAFTDTPWRERGQWWGDVHAENRIARVAFQDQRLLRRSLIYMADALQRSEAPGLVPNNQGLRMLDYSMLWVQDLAGYLKVTGDKNLATELFPRLNQLMKNLEKAENGRSGLLDLPEGPWSETAYIDVAARLSRSGQSAALNSIYYETLKQAAWVADFTGRSAAAHRWTNKSEKIRSAINNLLYRPEDHRYLASLSETGYSNPTVHSQAWPLAFDIIPEDQRIQATKSLLEMIPPDPAKSTFGTYGMLWILEALGNAGFFQQAVALIEDYYGYILQSGAQTWWEGFHAGEYPETSISHGWSGAPTWFLTNFILGARSDDLDRWVVRPSFSAVGRAAGRLPLASGVLEVEWQNPGCGESNLTISAPLQTRGEVVFPNSWQNLELLLDGESILGLEPTIQFNGFQDLQGTHIFLEGGAHAFSARYLCIP